MSLSTLFSFPSRSLRVRRSLFRCQVLLRNSSDNASTSSDSSAPDQASTIDTIEKLQASLIHKLIRDRKPIITFDHLSPTPTYLLNITLSDVLPRACQPATFLPKEMNLPDSFSNKPVLRAKDRKNRGPNLKPEIHSNRLLPQGHHLVYFPPWTLPGQLLPDGTDDLHSPGPQYTRRLWAGGSLDFSTVPEYQFFTTGMRAICYERIKSVQVKGQIGDEKVVVEVERKMGGVYVRLEAKNREERKEVSAATQCFHQGNDDPEEKLAVVETRKLVFMRERTEEEKKLALEYRGKLKYMGVPDYHFTCALDESLLFRFSALTFNAHRIHLDPTYCREVEGHQNLLVHGPLTVVLMLSAVKSQLGGLTKSDGLMIQHFEYKNIAPLYVNEKMKVCVKRNDILGFDPKDPMSSAMLDVWIEGPNGDTAVKGRAIVRQRKLVLSGILGDPVGERASRLDPVNQRKIDRLKRLRDSPESIALGTASMAREERGEGRGFKKESGLWPSMKRLGKGRGER